jgi:hypothetical protein
MQDPWNPTSAEITAWAYDPTSMWPEQDWDLAVTSDQNTDLLLQLASDAACPKRDFFLRCLYLFVGDAVRSGFVAHRHEVVVELLENVPVACTPEISRWLARSQKLLDASRGAVDYTLWCEGGYARAELPGD